MALGFFVAVFVVLAEDLMPGEIVPPDPLHHLFFVFHAFFEVTDALSEAASDGGLEMFGEDEVVFFVLIFIFFEFEMFFSWSIVHFLFHE